MRSLLRMVETVGNLELNQLVSAVDRAGLDCRQASAPYIFDQVHTQFLFPGLPKVQGNRITVKQVYKLGDEMPGVRGAPQNFVEEVLSQIGVKFISSGLSVMSNL